MTEQISAAAQGALTHMADHALVEAAAEKLLRTSQVAVQEPGRDRYVQSKTRGGTPVVVDDVERPSVVVEVFAPRYEDVLEHLALVGSPSVGRRLGVWLERVATYWEATSLSERSEAAGIAAELLGVKEQRRGGAFPQEDEA
ncbi:hypothetical protein [Streptomyces sp. NPDC091027]|uniref:hypothetical protein n=1 Tax=Streptomyces sp. NPDC091027 TaxID=3365971 RepID=UPI003819147E